MSNGNSVLDRIHQHAMDLAAQPKPGDKWEVGVYIDGERVEHLQRPDGTCESDHFLSEPE